MRDRSGYSCLLVAATLVVSILISLPAWAVPLGDTLTVIQRPLVNIPAIVTPGSTLTIECAAPSGSSGWGARLLYGSLDVPLTVQSATYDASTLWWQIDAVIPTVSVYELYDLVVTANGGIADTTWNAVDVVAQYETNYYFIQITDTHLPTELYYYESGADTDSSDIVDLREIIRDVNIINPAFVVITGDFIHEGELEDYLSKRYYSRGQRMLTEFQVPVYLTSGNHDIGGWTDTPPADGEARRNWWKFFGWPRLNNPPAGAPYYTQDYSFDYGPVHFVGLEAYLNYDMWRSNIYGGQSFTSAQMTWLSNDLAAASGSTERVLFYHSDYSNQINQTALDVGLALSGHTHSNTEDNTYPFKIVTNNACGGERSYRLVRVSNGVVQPTSTISAGSSGTNLNVTFSPANDGTHYSVTGNITNNINQRFEHAVLRFVMPDEPGDITVMGGTLTQVDRSGTYALCYVGVDILASSSRSVSVTLVPGDAQAPSVTVNGPNGSEVWNIGTSRNVTWTATDNVGVTSISILLSRDGGVTYPDTLAVGEANDGLYSWTVSGSATAAARIKVAGFDAASNSGIDASDSDFEIHDPASGINGDQIPPRFIVVGTTPNPLRDRTTIRFGLPEAGRVQIDVFEVSGRKIAAVVDHAYSAGYHEVEWQRDAGRLQGSGIYFLRVRFGGEEATIKIVVSR